MSMFKKGEGLFDFCLMNEVSEASFMDNLKQRFRSGNIYTYIGEQVVSVNPFTRKQIYGPQIMTDYRNRFMYEVQPHIYALADDTFRALLNNKENQCVLITGESGAGKTEASKIFMQYIAQVSKGSERADAIKNKLLESNPVLEAFGNAKTLRNDNSSRFGKYMEIQFDYAGAPTGGRISQYLLEKSRVVTRGEGERSFHIFYQLLSARDLHGALKLQADPSKYNYLNCSNCYQVNTINDASDFAEVKNAMTALGWSRDDISNTFKVLAAILHLGNVNFEDDPVAAKRAKTDCVKISNVDCVKTVAGLLECDAGTLESALKFRSISTGVGRRESHISVPLDLEQAVFTRDSLAKNLFNSLFSWVVTKINDNIKADNTNGACEVVIGVLDIYGFEILPNNSFEQFCINYCNEKLQQLFIENVLRSEQEEYAREGIEWTAIDYFDNQPIIDLIEGKKKNPGLIPLLDECCLVGKATAVTVVEKFSQIFRSHPHFQGQRGTNFKIQHYAGEVVYDTNSFLPKNRDTFFADLLAALQTSRNRLVQELFATDIAASRAAANDKSRPKTAGTQFKTSVCALVTTLQACQPHYIRCIKSNDQKKADFLDEERVRHQVLYLNLVETVRVRRAGFCNRQPYVRFLWRYKMLSTQTWPKWTGNDKAGTQAILNSLGFKAAEYRLGKTKLFIKAANTFMQLEQRRFEALPLVAVIIQKVWRGYQVRAKWFLHKCSINIQKFYRKYRGRRYFFQVKQAFAGLRDDPYFGRYTAMPSAPALLYSAQGYLERVARCYWAYRKVTALSAEDQLLMRQKVLAKDLFSGNKPWNCARPFLADYLNAPTNPRLQGYLEAINQLFQTYGDREILFAADCQKVNPKGKSQLRTFIVTDSNMYKYDPVKYVVKKEAMPLNNVTGISLSSQRDTFVIIHMESPMRDIVIDAGGYQSTEKTSELVTVLVAQIRKLSDRVLQPVFTDRITYNNSREADPQNPSMLKDPGKDISLMFGQNPKPSEACVFQSGKNQTATVMFP